MYFNEMINAVADAANDTTFGVGGTNIARTKGWLREYYYSEFIPLRDWSFLKKGGVVSSVAEYTTGTVAVTNGSTTITGTGTTFTSSMVGYRFKLSSDDRSYKISGFTSTTVVTIESAYEGDTASGKTFQIVKDTFNLSKWVSSPSRIYSFNNPNQGVKLTFLSLSDKQALYPNYSDIGTPEFYTPVGRVRTNYTTGTVSGTSASKTLTGSSTAWTTSNIEQFDQIQIGDYAYTVNSVNSDTSITIFESLITTVAALTTYTAVMDRYQVELYPMPQYVRGYPFIAQTMVPKLENSYDVPTIPEQYHHILVKGALVKTYKHNNDGNLAAGVSDLTNSLKVAISEDQRNYDTVETFRI